MTVTTIKVECKDPSHARGKIAKIVTFNLEFNRGRREWRPDLTPKIRAAQRGHLPPPAPYAGHRYPCKLCGQELTCGDDLLQEMLNTIAAGAPRAHQRAGVSETTLKGLIRIASTRRREGG